MTEVASSVEKQKEKGREKIEIYAKRYSHWRSLFLLLKSWHLIRGKKSTVFGMEKINEKFS